ncbi:hypothetical protein OG588_00430 [Streptomyces prunicolor]|uniref:hypothetical protein n=1 Tax=Streptomyces prunicolor TaxID=67348 RepID=UPI0038660CA1|nr:hypothetical protein OG588_00430 [Streptomyces prunicolor]
MQDLSVLLAQELVRRFKWQLRHSRHHQVSRELIQDLLGRVDDVGGEQDPHSRVRPCSPARRAERRLPPLYQIRSTRPGLCDVSRGR